MKKIISRRRKILLGITGVTQLPNTWIKPVIDSVVLPAHAQTSSTTTTDSPSTTAAPPLPPMPASLIYPGRSFDVCSPSGGPSFQFSINDADITAPFVDMSGSDVIIFPFPNIIPGAPSYSLTIIVNINGDRVSVQVTNTHNNQPSACFPSSSPQAAIAGMVTGTVNGTVYTVSGNLSVSGQNIILSDLIFTP